MSKLPLIFVLMSGLLISNALADISGLGLGVILGEPTGLSAKIWTTKSTAFDGAIAWSFYKNINLHIHADLLFHKFRCFKEKRGNLPFYFGIGGRIKLEEKSRVGARFPLGIEYIFTEAPMDFFLEFVPILDLMPGTDYRFNGAFGFRYFF